MYGAGIEVVGEYLREFQKHIDLPQVPTPLDNSIHHFHHPGGALSTRRALATRFVFIKLGYETGRGRQVRLVLGGNARQPNKGTHVCKPCNCGNNVSRFVHDNHGTGSQAGLSVLEGIIIHPDAHQHELDGPEAKMI